MALTWSNPRTTEQMRTALGSGSTGTDAPTVGATDGLDLRGLSAVRVHLDTAGMANGTVRFVGVLPGDTVTVNGTLFTAVGAEVIPTAVQFKTGSSASVGGIAANGQPRQKPTAASDFIAARNLADLINNTAAINGTLSALSSFDDGTILIRALADGAAGNALTLASSNGARAVLSGATLSGGAAAGAIAAGATLQASIFNSVTKRWSRAPDLDLICGAGLANQTFAEVRDFAPHSRLQYAPNGVGVACFIYLNGSAGKIP